MTRGSLLFACIYARHGGKQGFILWQSHKNTTDHEIMVNYLVTIFSNTQNAKNCTLYMNWYPIKMCGV